MTKTTRKSSHKDNGEVQPQGTLRSQRYEGTVPDTDITRRRFVTTVAAASASFAIVPRHVLGRGFEAPSDRLNVAVVGVGGQGRANMINLVSQNIVAMCDVDWDYAGKSFDRLETDAAAQKRR